MGSRKRSGGTRNFQEIQTACIQAIDAAMKGTRRINTDPQGTNTPGKTPSEEIIENAHWFQPAIDLIQEAGLEIESLSTKTSRGDGVVRITLRPFDTASADGPSETIFLGRDGYYENNAHTNHKNSPVLCDLHGKLGQFALERQQLFPIEPMVHGNTEKAHLLFENPWVLFWIKSILKTGEKRGIDLALVRLGSALLTREPHIGIAFRSKRLDAELEKNQLQGSLFFETTLHPDGTASPSVCCTSPQWPDTPLSIRKEITAPCSALFNAAHYSAKMIRCAQDALSAIKEGANAAQHDVYANPWVLPHLQAAMAFGAFVQGVTTNRTPQLTEAWETVNPGRDILCRLAAPTLWLTLSKPNNNGQADTCELLFAKKELVLTNITGAKAGSFDVLIDKIKKEAKRQTDKRALKAGQLEQAMVT